MSQPHALIDKETPGHRLPGVARFLATSAAYLSGSAQTTRGMASERQPVMGQPPVPTATATNGARL